MKTDLLGKTILLAKSKNAIKQVTYIAKQEGILLVKAHNPEGEILDLKKICVNFAGVYLHEINEYFCITGGRVNGHINPSSLSIPVSENQKFSIHSQSLSTNNEQADVAFYWVPLRLKAEVVDLVPVKES